MNKHKILSVGSVSVDIKAFSTIDDENEAYRDGTIDLVPGGVARGMAMNLNRLGLPSAVLTVVGNDIFGDYLKKGLIAEGVDTTLLRTSDTRKTSLFSVMASYGKPASCIYCNDVLSEITVDDEVRRYVAERNVDVLCIDSNVSETTLASLYGLKTACKPAAANGLCKPPFIFQNATAPDIAHKSLPYAALIDLFACNEFEAAAILNYAGISLPFEPLLPGTELSEAFRSLGFRDFIVTFGERGVLVHSGGGTYIEKPYAPPRIIDTIGAGDAFASGYLFGCLDGKPVRRCIQYGLACAKETLMTRQTVSDLLNADLLERYPDHASDAS